MQEVRAGGEIFFFFFSEGVAHVQLKPVRETNLHFLYFVVFFRLLKRKKILKRENDKKKKILVHEIKIFFFITWSSFMWIYWGGGFIVPLCQRSTWKPSKRINCCRQFCPLRRLSGRSCFNRSSQAGLRGTSRKIRQEERALPLLFSEVSAGKPKSRLWAFPAALQNICSSPRLAPSVTPLVPFLPRWCYHEG